MRAIAIAALTIGPALAGAAAAHAAVAADSVATPRIALRVGGTPIPYDVLALFVLPGEALTFAAAAPRDSGLAIRATAGALETQGRGQWRWVAPAAIGAYPLGVVAPDGRAIALQVFVMVPFDSLKDGMIGRYPVGSYARATAERGAAYERPRGFVEVDAATDTLRVSPHFRLRQFLCKDGHGYPKYVALRTPLLVKLERLLAAAREHGLRASTFHVMSGYRTPSYNRRIGNTTSLSRHHYGDAADVFVDERPVDGVMDDLDGDGKSTRADAEWLGRWADRIDREDADLAGGLSAYGSTAAHGPFLHVDVRGRIARW